MFSNKHFPPKKGMSNFGGNNTSNKSITQEYIDNKSDNSKRLLLSIYSKKFFEHVSHNDKTFYVNKKTALFKTEMCRSFTELGFCKYGNNCQFCHSKSEQRKIRRHPKYKTEICRTFWEEGSCPYGRRCCFAHLERQNLSKDSSNIKLSNIEFEIDENLSLELDSVECESLLKKTLEDNCSNIKIEFYEIENGKVILKVPSLENKELFFKDLFAADHSRLETLKDCRISNFCDVAKYSRIFTPYLSDVEKVEEYKSIWESNDMNIWTDEPKFFVITKEIDSTQNRPESDQDKNIN